MALFKQTSLRNTLIRDILIMGLIGIALVTASAAAYRHLAYRNQEEGLHELLQLAAESHVADLRKNVIDLGMDIQRDEALREALRSGDAQTIQPRLTSQYHRYFVTAGVIKLEAIYAFDAQWNLRAASNFDDRISEGSHLCPNLIAAARERQGPERLKPLSSLCTHDNYAYYSVMVPVGGLRPFAYLQVTVDPTYNLAGIDKTLGLPAEILLPDDTIAYRSPKWPNTNIDDHFLFGRYNAADDSGQTVFTLAVVREVAPFKRQLDRTNLIVMSVTIAATSLVIFFALMRMRRSLRPLKELRTAAEALSKGELHPVADTSFPEINIPIQSFNRMASHITDLIDKLEKEIEDRKLIERELIKNRKQLEETRDKAFAASQAKSTFLANMSHELRTPLNAIIGYGEMLLDEARELDEDVFSEDIHKILGSARHLLGIINEILDLSKIEAGRMELHLEPLKVELLIEEVADLIRPLAERRHIEFAYNVHGPLGEMTTDILKLRQALVNLLSNACKFTHEGGVRLDVFRNTVNGKDWVRFVVSDTGIGIKPEHLEKLFSEFTQADASTTRQYGGTGLGLVISQRLCEMMGGYISVSSAPGEGSTFAIYLPVLSPPRSRDADEEVESENAVV